MTIQTSVSAGNDFQRAADGGWFGRLWHESKELGGGVAEAGKGIRDFFSQAAGAIGDAAQHPAGNPWMQGLAALGAAVLAWKFLAPMLTNLMFPGSGKVSESMRLVSGLAIVGAVAFGAAATVGTFGKDEAYEKSRKPQVPERAGDHPALQQPPQAQPSLSLGPPGS